LTRLFNKYIFDFSRLIPVKHLFVGNITFGRLSGQIGPLYIGYYADMKNINAKKIAKEKTNEILQNGLHYICYLC